MNKLKFKIGIFSVFGLICIYFAKNYYTYQKEIDEIICRKINGIIIQTKKRDRDFLYIKIFDYNTNSKFGHDFQSGWFFKDNNIQIHDSVSKIANSRILTFYKFQNGGYRKCCDYEMTW